MIRNCVTVARTLAAISLISLLSVVSVAASPGTGNAATLRCHPLTNGGHCYEPGEYCRHTDAGKRGVAGDRERIVCRNNNGLRWEPY